MYDQSFSLAAIEHSLQKRDFKGIAQPLQQAFKDAQVLAAQQAAFTLFAWPANPLAAFPLLGKQVFQLPALANELVERRIRSHLKYTIRLTPPGRAHIVETLRLLLSEGVPYRVYRLDIKSFYESFSDQQIIGDIDSISMLNPLSKRLLAKIIEHHRAMGGTGLPRGLSSSAAISELMMKSFDSEVSNHDHVFFYARYVDDIIAITSGQENSIEFKNFIEKSLPQGLRLNQAKTDFLPAVKRVSPVKSPALPTQLFAFDYLGYRYSVKEPAKNSSLKDGEHHRKVMIDIARSKIKRFKTRIARSFLDFSKTSDWALLQKRIKFLTQNFSIYDGKISKRKLAGIYHSYPQLSAEATGLQELDHFLRNSILSRNGKISKKTSSLLTGEQKRALLRRSFAHGHANQSFVHFSATDISNIQRCWEN